MSQCWNTHPQRGEEERILDEAMLMMQNFVALNTMYRKTPEKKFHAGHRKV